MFYAEGKRRSRRKKILTTNLNRKAAVLPSRLTDGASPRSTAALKPTESTGTSNKSTSGQMKLPNTDLQNGSKLHIAHENELESQIKRKRDSQPRLAPEIGSDSLIKLSTSTKFKSQVGHKDGPDAQIAHRDPRKISDSEPQLKAISRLRAPVTSKTGSEPQPAHKNCMQDHLQKDQKKVNSNLESHIALKVESDTPLQKDSNPNKEQKFQIKSAGLLNLSTSRPGQKSTDPKNLSKNQIKPTVQADSRLSSKNRSVSQPAQKGDTSKDVSKTQIKQTTQVKPHIVHKNGSDSHPKLK